MLLKEFKPKKPEGILCGFWCEKKRSIKYAILMSLKEFKPKNQKVFGVDFGVKKREV